MKKIALLAFLFFFSPLTVFGAAGDNCAVDITQEGIYGPITGSVNWRDIMLVRGSDGYLWQRAIITSQSEGIKLEEGKPLNIYGVAAPHSAVQVFVFTRVDNDISDNIKGIVHPDTGVCWESNPADFSGLFSFGLNSGFLWGNLGNDQIIDAFYRTDTTWNQFLQNKSDTTENIFVGTHVDPRVIDLGGAGVGPPNCTELCSATGLVESVALRPDTIDGRLTGTNFDAVLGSSVTVSRFPGQHTFYAKSASGAGDNDSLRWLAQKSILMEVLKRRLLGMANTGGLSPGITTITRDTLVSAFEETDSSSVQTRALVKNIQGLMTSSSSNTASPSPVDQPLPPDPPLPPTPPLGISRDEALAYLNPIFVLDSPLKNDNLLTEIFPEGVSNLTTWADDLVRIINFWTASLDINECLLFDDAVISKNYDWHEEQRGALQQCGYPYVSGSTPTLVLHTKNEIRLSPDFQNASIIAADTWFTSDESWNLPVGEKKPFTYNYKIRTPFHGKYMSKSCLRKEDVPEFAEFLTEENNLLPSEKSAIVSELNTALRLTHSFVRLQMADPKDISEFISWKGNEKPLDILQLFFAVKEGACEAKDFGGIKISTNTDRDGFEVGIVNEN